MVMPQSSEQSCHHSSGQVGDNFARADDMTGGRSGIDVDVGVSLWRLRELTLFGEVSPRNEERGVQRQVRQAVPPKVKKPPLRPLRLSAQQCVERGFDAVRGSRGREG